MQPARAPRSARLDERLLRVDARGAFQDGRVRDLPALLAPGDLLVVNDSATLPASLEGIAPGGARVEVRLCVFEADGGWRAALFGSGDWRARTEDRGPPPSLAPGERIRFSPALFATVKEVSRESPRLVWLAFSSQGAELWTELYRRGRPIQYSYLTSALALWDAQTAYAARPWSVEMPSAGRPLTWELLARLRGRGVQVAALTHAAGISSLGSPELDALLPFPERYEIPPRTVEQICAAKARGGRVVAAGTTVVRALEGAARGGLSPGPGVTDLRVGPGFRPRVVDALLTGMHEAGTSHRLLLEAFAPHAVLEAALAHAEEAGYLGHEFGDSTLVLAA